MVEGWRVRWRERELEIQVDADFPFSRPRVYLLGYSRNHAQPHIECDGKLCLGSATIPGDRVRNIQMVLAETFQLLTENDTKQHEEDFREDFGLYWLNWADRSDLRVEIMPGREGIEKSVLGRAILTERRIFVFAGKSHAGRFWTNLTGAAPKRLKETPIIFIDPLPYPNRYPATADELWSLVEARSRAGTDLLTRLMANAPKDAFVVIAGKAPSGREHYAAVQLRRPMDRERHPLKRSIMRKGVEKSELQPKKLFGRFQLDRLATLRVDSSSSRLPDGVQRHVAGCKVIVAGCGALGSGVARMLAHAGVEHIHLVDPENLGWENIRRHELGGNAVGLGKARTLATAIRAALPMIGFVEGYPTTFATFAREHPEAIKQADLIVSCTGDWAADASVEHAIKPDQKASAVYGWMEAHALASHAVFLDKVGARLSEGFDEWGRFRLAVVAGGKPAPPECGGTTTTFGAVELSQAQALVARLAIDALRGLEIAPVWHSWLADSLAFEEAEASITPEWVAARGQPEEAGGFYSAEWSFS